MKVGGLEGWRVGELLVGGFAQKLMPFVRYAFVKFESVQKTVSTCFSNLGTPRAGLLTPRQHLDYQ